MQVKVLFFASFKELLGKESIEVTLNEQANVELLCESISQYGAEWLELFGNPGSGLKVSINQEMAALTDDLKDGDEVAFFPPVTGG